MVIVDWSYFLHTANDRERLSKLPEIDWTTAQMIDLIYFLKESYVRVQRTNRDFLHKPSR